jgi:hypothetical protein
MADYLINVFLDDAKMKIIEGAGLAGQVKDLGGKKAVQVPLGEKEQKKLAKGFPSMAFDASNACVLPPEAETNLVDIIVQMKPSMAAKVAIMKLYNPWPANRFARPH